MFRKYLISILIESWLYKQGNLRTSQQDGQNWILPPGYRIWTLPSTERMKEKVGTSGIQSQRAGNLWNWSVAVLRRDGESCWSITGTSDALWLFLQHKHPSLWQLPRKQSKITALLFVYFGFSCFSSPGQLRHSKGRFWLPIALTLPAERFW